MAGRTDAGRLLANGFGTAGMAAPGRRGVDARPEPDAAYSSPDIKKAAAVRPFSLFGRRDWIRTNDPHHVKVVL